MILRKEGIPCHVAAGMAPTGIPTTLRVAGVDGMYRFIYLLEIDTRYTVWAPTVGKKWAISRIADRAPT